jgi:hypothetical protein
MTAYDPSTDTPPAINLLEQAAAHAILTLHNLYKSQEYKEAAGTGLDSGLAPLVDVSIINAADGTIRLITRAAFEVAPEYATDPGKLWTFINSFGSAAVPSAYKVD